MYSDEPHVEDDLEECRSNVEGLPDCPDDLSEPQYASLLFEHTCQVRIRRTLHGH